MSLIGTLTVIGNVAGAAVAPLMGGVSMGSLLGAGTGATGALAGTAGTGLGATLGAAGVGTGAGGALAPTAAAAAPGAAAAPTAAVAPGTVAPGAAAPGAAAPGAAVAPGAAAAPGASSGVLGTGLTTGSATGDALATTATISAGTSGIKEGAQAGLNAEAQSKANNLFKGNTANQTAQLNKTGAMAGDLYGPQSGNGGWATPQPGMFSAKEGGEIALETGQFVIPADIVSALGNGDTEAGQRFLTEFFNDYA